MTSNYQHRFQPSSSLSSAQKAPAARHASDNIDSQGSHAATCWPTISSPFLLLRPGSQPPQIYDPLYLDSLSAFTCSTCEVPVITGSLPGPRPRPVLAPNKWVQSPKSTGAPSLLLISFPKGIGRFTFTYQKMESSQCKVIFSS